MVTALDANKAYQDYRSIWRNKPRQVVEAEIHVIENWSHEIDKYLYREQLKSNEKLDILKGILNESI